MDTDSAIAGRHALLPASEQVWHAFLAALDALPADACAVLLLHDVFGVPVAEIAPALCLPVPACGDRLAQARRCVRAHAPPLEIPTP